MLSKVTAQLVEEIFEYFDKEDKEKAQKEPEVCLVSILLAIKERLPEISATLSMTIEMAPWDDSLKEAREKLKETSPEVS